MWPFWLVAVTVWLAFIAGVLVGNQLDTLFPKGAHEESQEDRDQTEAEALDAIRRARETLLRKCPTADEADWIV